MAWFWPFQPFICGMAESIMVGDDVSLETQKYPRGRHSCGCGRALPLRRGRGEKVHLLRLGPRAFLDGALEVCPDTAQFIDGKELGYRLEAASGDFWHVADHQRRSALPLVAPDLRAKYLATVGVSFGQYIDSYIFPDTGPRGECHKGPLNGSRLARFRANLAQAADAADEYVWMWNEFHPYVKWRRNERGADLMAKGTLEETLPGALHRPLLHGK